MFSQISPTKKNDHSCETNPISKKKKPGPTSEMLELNKNVQNLAEKRLKTGESSFSIRTIASLSEKENCFSQNFNFENSFDRCKSSIKMQSNAHQIETIEDKESITAAKEIKPSHLNFRPQKREQKKKELTKYELLYKNEYLQFETIINGENTTLKCMGTGSVMKAYDVSAKKQLCSGIENDEILVKLYKLTRNKGIVSSSQLNSLRKLMETAIESYKKARDLEIPQAILYNIDSAIDDCYFIVEKIHDELDIKCCEQMAQVKNLFRIYFEKQIVLDLAPANLRVQTKLENKKIVVLVDYMETDKKIQNNLPRDEFFEHILKRWYNEIKKNFPDLSKNEKENKAIGILVELTKGLDEYGFNPTWIVNATI